MIGEVVGGYRIVSPLGQGSTGVVFAAEHASVGSHAAIKIIAPHLAADPSRLQAYLREAQTASRIGNQGTVKIEAVGMPAGYGHGFVVMELLQGETLAQRIARTKRLSITQIAEIGRQIATIVAAIHDENLVHRDLRPDKIFLVRDSGLAQEKVKILVGDTALLGPTHEKAAPYVPPEVWRDPSAGDWRVDVYAFGCMIFEMATGTRPYGPPDLGMKHNDYPIPTARSLMPDVPPVLDGLIARLMGKLVDQRPKSMREISRELDGLGGNVRPLAPTKNDTPALVVGEMNAPTLQGAPAQQPLAPTADPTPARRPSRLPIIIAALVLILGGVIAVVLAVK